jgi:hypothetical protein
VSNLLRKFADFLDRTPYEVYLRARKSRFLRLSWLLAYMLVTTAAMAVMTAYGIYLAMVLFLVVVPKYYIATVAWLGILGAVFVSRWVGWFANKWSDFKIERFLAGEDKEKQKCSPQSSSRPPSPTPPPRPLVPPLGPPTGLMDWAGLGGTLVPPRSYSLDEEKLGQNPPRRDLFSEQLEKLRQGNSPSLSPLVEQLRKMPEAQVASVLEAAKQMLLRVKRRRKPRRRPARKTSRRTSKKSRRK